MTTQEKINLGYLKLCSFVIYRSFIPSNRWLLCENKRYNINDIKREFVRHGRFIEMFADCTDYSASKIKKQILIKNGL